MEVGATLVYQFAASNDFYEFSEFYVNITPLKNYSMGKVVFVKLWSNFVTIYAAISVKSYVRHDSRQQTIGIYILVVKLWDQNAVSSNDESK